MSEFAASATTAEDDDPDGTRILGVNAVLDALDAFKGSVATNASTVASLLAQQEAASAARHESRQELLRQLADEPHKFGFFQAVRLLENAHPGLPRVGTSLRLRDDPIRFAQAPSLSFAPAALARFTPAQGDTPPTLHQRFFGLFGANGPLPLHLTEYARERARRMPSDRALVRFLDMFHHRLLSLLYRAWAEAQPAVSLDRPDNDPFSRWVGSVAGYGQTTLSGRDSVPDGAQAGGGGHPRTHGSRRRRPRAHPQRFLPRARAGAPVASPHWMRLPEEARSRLGSRDAPVALGQSAVIGAKVWDCQTRFRVEIGPVTLAQYERFLPGGESLRRLHDWVLSYVGHELSCEMHLVLKKAEVPAVTLGRTGAWGWTSWLGRRPTDASACDLVAGHHLRARERVRTATAAPPHDAGCSASIMRELFSQFSSGLACNPAAPYSA